MKPSPKTLRVSLIGVIVACLWAAAPARAVPEFLAFETEGVPPAHTLVPMEEATVDGESSAAAHAYRVSTTNGTEASLFLCTKATLTGTWEQKTNTQLTLTPGYQNCITGTLLPVDVRINGCDYRYRVETKLEEDRYEGSLEVVCATGKSIEFESTSGGKRVCLATIPAQKGISPIFFQDMTEGSSTDFTIVEEPKNVTNITDNGSLACGIGIGDWADGKLVGETTVTATNKGKAQVDFEVAG